MNIDPIHTPADHEAALARILVLMDICEIKGETCPESDELDILATLVEAYEAKHYPIGPADPIEAIKFRMEQMGLEPKDLTPIIGSRSKVSEVLNHKRPLSLNMIRNLHDKLNVPLETLIRQA